MNEKEIEAAFYSKVFRILSMILLNSKKCLCVLLFMNFILNIIATSIEEIAKEEIRIDTQYAREEFYLTWRIINYSTIFDTVQAEFSLKNSSTTWKLNLIDKAHIYLERTDTKEPVTADIEYRLITHYKTFADKKFQKFDAFYHPSLKLLDLEMHSSRDKRVAPVLENHQNEKQQKPIKFDNDVFKLHFSMKILGPPITRIVRSSDFLKV